MNDSPKGRSDALVTPDKTAAAMGSGSLPVFATPALAALMEQAACDALEERLPEGVTTVGTRLDISHTAATPQGMRVWAEAVLTGVQDRTYTFAITAFDEAGEIGRALHQRVSVKAQRFLEKTQAKGLEEARCGEP